MRSFVDRRTCLVRLELGSGDTPRALDTETSYDSIVRIDNAVFEGRFASPLGDYRYRALMLELAECTSGRGSRTMLNHVLAAGRNLASALGSIHHKVAEFLQSSGERRLVIQTNRPELHQLPWEAITDTRERINPKGLSIVRCEQGFSLDPYQHTDELRVAPFAGPRTDKVSLEALAMLPDFELWESSTGMSRISPEKLKSADFVHIEAHGAEEDGTIEWAENINLDPDELAIQIGSPIAALLWSCFSNQIGASWGRSPASALHNAGAKAVLAFSTPLRYSDARLASGALYSHLLDPRHGGDIETTVQHMRDDRIEKDRQSCVWASMALWLRCPLDLTGVLRQGPRLPAEAWSAETAPAPDERDQFLRSQPGIVDVSSVKRQRPLHASQADSFSGAAVVLAGLGDEIDDVLADLGKPETRKRHFGEKLIDLISVLDSYGDSLLLWVDAPPNAINLARYLHPIAQHTTVLLSSDQKLLREHKYPELDGGSLDNLETLIQRAQFDKVRNLIGAAGSGGYTEQDAVRHSVIGYLAFSKANQLREAQNYLENLNTLAKQRIPNAAFEAKLRKGNFVHRKGRREQARRYYEDALRLANGDLVLEARANIELGYVSSRTNTQVSEYHTRTALTLLEEDNASEITHAWSDARGRAWKDLAAVGSLDAPEKERIESAKRAIAIHAFDGRPDELAKALWVRGNIEMSQNRFDDAEQSYIASLDLRKRAQVEVGIVDAVRSLAELAERRGDLSRALMLLNQVKDREPRRVENLLQIAQLAWQTGDFDYCIECSRNLTQLIPSFEVLQRAESLLSAAEALRGNNPR